MVDSAGRQARTREIVPESAGGAFKKSLRAGAARARERPETRPRNIWPAGETFHL